MFKKIKEKRDEKGFTLIELLIVVAIIAILAAIAIPQFSGYRERGVRASMVADARNVATVLEAYFTDFGSYAITPAAVGPGPTTGTWSGQTIKASRGNTVDAPTANAASYAITVGNGGSGAGKSPLTLNSTGNCSFADGSAC